ncbi:hypothetical protein HHI36_001984 [Cryptolaemus montrouzieri]|uniref:Ionotropic receptor n=1 Tax=Cryptolaemus montrouzieri TaxID=559131 RepID=A0ABD2P9L7_9CUCU
MNHFKLLLLCTQTIFINIYQIEKKNQISTYLKEYFRNKEEFVFCTFVDVDEFYPEIVDQDFLDNCAHIIFKTTTNTDVHSDSFKELPTHAIFFFQNYEDIEEKIKYSLKYGFYVPRTPTLFVLGKPMENTEFVEEFMKILWKMKAYRFEVIFFHKRFESLGYNPYKKIIVNYTDIGNNSTNIHAEFTDLYGYHLRLAMFEYPPRNYRTNDGDWRGEDDFFWENLFRDLNMSADIVETQSFNYEAAKIAVLEGRADFCPLRYFETNVSDNMDYTAPYTIEYLVAIVPISQKIPQYLYIISIFHELVWVNLLAVLISMPILFLAIEKFSPTARKKNVTSAFFDILGICIGRPIKGYYAYNRLQKFMFILWQLDNIILIAAFQCALITSLLVSKYGDQIDTIEALQKSNLTIYTPSELGFMVDFYTDATLKKQLRNISARHYSSLLKSKLEYQALVVPYSLSKVVLHDLKESDRVDEFRLMKEALIPGFTTYFFEKNSPYITIIDQMVMRKYQYGFNREKMRRRFPKTKQGAKDSVSLSLSHLQGAFFIMLSGVGLGTVSFVLEIWPF